VTPAAACAALAVLELDATLVAQTLVSRPLVVGAALGWLGGRSQSGAFLGAAFELLALCDLPVGGSLTWSAPVAAGTATILLCGGTSYALCFAGGLAAGVLHSHAEAFERRRRAASVDSLAGRAGLGRAMGLSLAGHAAMTFAVAGACVALTALTDRHVWPHVPEMLRSGASFAASSAPWIGLSGVAAWGFNRA
jgi:mannose/fructose/N-acetylgalactosamine-specific phosphotransferase system component IIC